MTADIPQKHIEHARELIAGSFVMDAHFDLGCDLGDRREQGAAKVYSDRHERLVKSGGWDCLVSSLFIHSYQLPEMALRKALGQISAIISEISEQPDKISLCTGIKEVDEANSSGKTAIMLSFEGVEPIGNDLSLLQIFYKLGVRAVGLAWSRRNYAADGCSFSPVREGQKGGLTAFGVQVVEEAERLGMLLDISHLNDEGVSDFARYSKKPFIASHSNCRALVPQMRNLTDGQIRLVAERDGVIGMNCCSAFVKDSASVNGERIGPRDLVPHMRHIIDLVGDRHVGLGLDCCDRLADFHATPANLEEAYDSVPDHSHLPELVACMIEGGIGDDAITGILGANFRRVYGEVIGE